MRIHTLHFSGVVQRRTPARAEEVGTPTKVIIQSPRVRGPRAALAALAAGERAACRRGQIRVMANNLSSSASVARPRNIYHAADNDDAIDASYGDRPRRGNGNHARSKPTRKLLASPIVKQPSDSGTESITSSDYEDDHGLLRPQRPIARITLRPHNLPRATAQPIYDFASPTNCEFHSPTSSIPRSPIMYSDIDLDSCTSDEDEDVPGWECAVCTFDNAATAAPVCAQCRLRRSDGVLAKSALALQGVAVPRHQASIRRVARRWGISDSDAAELMMNFELANAH